MSHQNLDDIIANSAKEELNPFGLLGLEDWIYRTLNLNELKSFLGDYKKVIAKHHHPDKFQDVVEKKRHESYFKLVTSAIDRLLTDGFYLENSLAEFKSGTNVDKYKRLITAKDAQIARNETEISTLTSEIKSLTEHKNNTSDLITSQSMTNMNLWFSPNATHLVPGLKCNLSYVNLYDYDFEFTYGLNAIITSSTSLQDIDSRGIKFAEQFIKQKYETMLERKSRKRGKKDTPRPQDTKTLPVFEDEYMENREFVLQRIGEKNADFLIAYKILGTIPYSAINSYFKFNRKKIVEPGDFSSKSKLDKPFAPIIREFTFEDHPGLNPSAQKRIEMISPFLTQLIMPYVPMLVQESKLVRGSMSTEYGLMIPTEIKYQ